MLPSSLEGYVGSKSIEEQFREQAELIDRLFIYRFDEYDRKMDARLAALDSRLVARLEATLETKLEQKLESKFSPIRSDLAFLKDTVTVILHRLA
jgi:hypothetical protein